MPLVSLSRRVRQLSPSPTLALDAKVKELQAKGVAVINLCLGEPDFPTPAHIGLSGIKAIREGFTHYTATGGILPLRRAIAQKLSRENKISYEPAQVLVGVGSKQLLYHAFQALVQEGSEVLLSVPTWSTYVEQIRLARATPVIVSLKPPFKLAAKDLQKRVTPKTKVILLNSPANPTGAIIEKKELIAIAKLAAKNNIFVISDEIYEKIVYRKKSLSIASLGEEIKRLTITISGFSKAYAMTGWRIGYAAGPRVVIEAMASLQSQTTSCTSSIAQMAATTALTGSQKSVERMRKEFAGRRCFLIEKLAKIRPLSFIPPEGTFYFFVNMGKLLGGQYRTSEDWCRGLLEKKQVAVVPGEAFLSPGYFRLSFAASLADLKEAVKRISEFTNRND